MINHIFPDTWKQLQATRPNACFVVNKQYLPIKMFYNHTL